MEVENKTTFWKLMNDPSYKMIKIPNIQRDYVQGRDTEHVERTRKDLLKDIAESLKDSKKIIDLNFIYGKVDSECFIPIDGQQRLTTLFLIHTFAFSKEEQYSDNLKILQEKFTYETRTTTKRFFENLTKKLPIYFKEKQYDNIEKFILDADWFLDTWRADPSVNSSLVVLKEIEEIFSDIENFSEKLISNDCPIVFMSLFIDNMGQENDLYIKMNSRGKTLTDFETFKSEFFKYIKDNDTGKWPKFKQKIDNEWMSMIWDSIDEPYIYTDALFLNLIRAIIYNRVIAYKDNYDSELIENIKKNIIYIYDDYKAFLKDTIDDIYRTFQFLEYMQKKYKEKYAEITNRLFNKLKIHDDLELKDRVTLFAITKYAMAIKTWNIDSFSSWYRIINNLINNTPIDSENRFKNACLSIDAMSEDLLMDSDTYFAQTRDIDIQFFADIQLKEEIYKCKLIKKDKRWKNAIIKAESHDYFKGEIAFSLKLIGANLDDYNTIKYLKLEEFNNTWEQITKFYDEIYNKADNDNLFKMALLTIGNYAVDAHSSNTFFFEGGDGYFNFRDLLREDNSFSIFQIFFEYLKDALNQNQDIIEFLKEMIDNYNDKTDMFRYYLIKVPELFESMKENRFIEDKNKNRIILYKKYKLSGGYSEFYSFVLKNKLKDSASYKFGYGYLNLDNPETSAYIDKIDGKDCHIEYYDGKFRDEDGTVLKTNNGSEVVTVDDAIKYVEEKFNYKIK